MDSKRNNGLKEVFGPDLSDRVFLASLCAGLTGTLTGVKVRGTRRQMEAAFGVMVASKDLHEELRRPDATLSSVTEKIRIKNEAALVFESSCGMKWPL